jgi:hypothetical protein
MKLLFVLLMSGSWAATPPPPPFDTSKLKALHLCLDDFAKVCYRLERVQKAATEIKENANRFEKKEISGVEFEERVRELVGKVKPPLKATSDCAPRLVLRLDYSSEQRRGIICLDQDVQKEGSLWWPYFR